MPWDIFHAECIPGMDQIDIPQQKQDECDL